MIDGIIHRGAWLGLPLFQGSTKVRRGLGRPRTRVRVRPSLQAAVHGRAVRRMRRWIALGMLVGSLGIASGCGLGPRNFRKIRHPSPLVRARALSLGDRRPSAQVIPALVARLDDADPVVRLAAHEELKRRTGQDFGYVAWEEEPERRAAVARWRAWLSGRPVETTPPPRAPSKTPVAPREAPSAPTASPQYRETIRDTPARPPIPPPTTRFRQTIRG